MSSVIGVRLVCETFAKAVAAESSDVQVDVEAEREEEQLRAKIAHQNERSIDKTIAGRIDER